MLNELKNADPVRGLVIGHDEELLTRLVAEPRAVPARRRRKAVVAAWFGAILVPVVGVGAASGASGLIPAGATGAFWGMNHGEGRDTQMDLTTARVVFSEPGPAGKTFNVWTATNGRGNYGCQAFTLVPAGGRDVPPSGWHEQSGAACSVLPHGTQGFDQLGGGSGGTDSPTLFALSAGPAVRAELLLNGTVLPLQVQNGWIAGWVASGVRTREATVTGYDAHGRVVGRADESQVGAP